MKQCYCIVPIKKEATDIFCVSCGGVIITPIKVEEDSQEEINEFINYQLF